MLSLYNDGFEFFFEVIPLPDISENKFEVNIFDCNPESDKFSKLILSVSLFSKVFLLVDEKSVSKLLLFGAILRSL